MSMEQFFTRQIANEGKQFPLYAPDGSKTEHWLRIRGIDSDVFRMAEAKAKRDAVKLAEIEDFDERVKAIMASEREVVATLVSGWSFDEECTHSNVVKLFEQAPQLWEMVNQIAARRSAFFAHTPQNSADGQSES